MGERIGCVRGCGKTTTAGPAIGFVASIDVRPLTTCALLGFGTCDYYAGDADNQPTFKPLCVVADS